MAATNFNQSGGELRMQDGGAHESRPCRKTAHQPQRRTRIGLTDFHGDTNHARVFAKMSRNFKIHVTNFHKKEFVLGGKLPTGLEGLESVFSYFFPSDSRINLYTCKSNVKQLYLLKSPNSLQEGAVSNLQTTCVHY